MSDRDLLALAARELRDSADGPRGDAARTRQRVLLAARTADRRRLRIVTWLVPMAAALVISTAWAGARGALPGVLRSLRTVVTGRDVERAAVRAAPAPVAGDRAGAPAQANVPRAADAAGAPQAGDPWGRAEPPPPLVDVESLPHVSDPARSSPRGPAAAEGRAVPGPAAGSAGPHLALDEDAVDEDALYEAAHRAHFVDRDPEAALRGWDAYLRAAPNGRLAIEARYDRAITLARLHRDAEARAALAPFAAGAYDGYRREEATRLLEALGVHR